MEPRRMEPRGEREERGSSFVAPTKKGEGEFHPADRPADTCACECEECHPRPTRPNGQAREFPLFSFFTLPILLVLFPWV